MGGAEAGCVDDVYGDAVHCYSFYDQVAGGAGGGGDDGSVAFDEAVEEGRLAGVGAAYDGECEAVSDDAGVGEGSFEFGQGGVDGVDLGEDLGGGEEVEVVFDEVDSGFEFGDESDEAFFDGSDAAGERSAELLGGEAGLVEGLGFDEVVDGFGLGEVEASGEEGALGELARLGEAGSVGDALADEIFEQDGGAVGGDLDYVLRGVGVGGGEEGYYCFV